MKEGEQRLLRAVVERARSRRRTSTRPTSRLVWTAHHWQHWLDRGEFPDHPWRQYLQRSALTLKGLTYAPTGALIAAATTSLPETPQRRAQLGLPLQLDPRLDVHACGRCTRSASTGRPTTSSTSSPTSPTREEDLQVMYGVGGERDLDEHVLDHLERLRGRAAGADRQRRLQAAASTTSGARCSTPSTCTRARATRSTSGSGRSSSARSRQAIENWRKPDRGIWEVRGEPKHFTSSKMFCWVACDRGARLAMLREDHERAERWQGRGRRDPRRRVRARRRLARRVRPALRHRRPRRLACC